MFTLRIIFYGLVALVPSAQNDSMTALLVDATGANIASDNCPVASHSPYVATLAGTCEGDCIRASSHAVLDPEEPGSIPVAEFLKALGLGHETGEVISALHASRQQKQRKILPRDKLHIWLPMKEHIVIKTTDQDHWGYVSSSSAPSPFPANTAAVSDFGWLPKMNRLGVTDVNKDCLNKAVSCPLASRFKIDQGDINVCSIVHKGKKLGKRKVISFKFESIDGKNVISGGDRAMGDAVLVEVDVKSTSVDLEAWTFDGKTRTGRATLKPVDNVVTILVANWPAPNKGPGARANGDCKKPGVMRHFELFYKLAASPPRLPPVPKLAKEKDFKQLAGFCENILTKDTGIYRPFNPPYHSGECSIPLFPPQGK